MSRTPQRRFVPVLAFIAAMSLQDTVVAQQSNVFVDNQTDSTVIVRFDHIKDMSGTQHNSSAHWIVQPRQSTRLTLRGENLSVSAVGYYVETTFGARTPTQHGKVWYQTAQGSDDEPNVTLTITEDKVLKLPQSKAELEQLLASLESSIEILGREVRYYERLKESSGDDFVLLAINASAYFSALDRYQRAVKIRQAVVSRLASVD